MQIQTRDTCPSCKGNPTSRHPMWVEWDIANAAHKLKNNGNEIDWQQTTAWFKSKGYSLVPDETQTCATCKGSSFIYKWILLSEFKKLL